ncbi:serine protein kinase RIO [Methanospirillum stamsii]|uniref:non-specific serine/threonine protein kinase n=1 Tax=Methanospirillum stamsii TaxID=1277351 RepID=A0A2V2N0B1_9EURY|nr:serine protein kinase RIO [Methanospirillum stamsii]PWR71076.1 serine/threonine protein kinase [Methanospirillum stamsii]
MRDRHTDKFDKQVDELRTKIKGLDQLKVRDDVFDEYTLLGLYKLLTKGWISAMGGPISTGKEANVYLADRNGTPVAVKIYLTRTANFKKMLDYIAGDRRFINIGKSRRDVIFAWTRKEYSNLKRAKEAGIRVPEPLVFDRNVLVMEYLGDESRAFPQLRLAEPDNFQRVYDELIEVVKNLWKTAKLVHGDLSEYNILYGEGHPYLIDMGQAVTLDHLNAPGFLKRDLEQLNRFFSERCTVRDVPGLLEELCGTSPQ